MPSLGLTINDKNVTFYPTIKTRLFLRNVIRCDNWMEIKYTVVVLALLYQSVLRLVLTVSAAD